MVMGFEKKRKPGIALAGLLVLSACLMAANGLGAGRIVEGDPLTVKGMIDKPLSGRWSGSAEIRTSEGGSNTLQIVADFRMDGAMLKGSIGPSPEQRFEISEASDSGGEVVFRAAMPSRVYRFRLERKGEDVLEGDLRSDDGKVQGRLRLSRAPVAGPAEPPDTQQKPGAVERAALDKVGFLTGEWEGEGWTLNRAGERTRFWIKETYRYRGDKDLLDMEGRFRDILPDGTKSGEEGYALGILYYDRDKRDYFMWHYSSDGTVFDVRIEVDAARRSAQYSRDYPGSGPGVFRIVIGEDGTWVTTLEILRPGQTPLKVMEFRMKRLTGTIRRGREYPLFERPDQR